MKLHLTSSSMDRLTLPPGQRELFAWDTELERFGLRLQASHDEPRRTYVVQYRANGRSRRAKVGEPDKLTLTKARLEARKILARVTLGDDPQGEKRAKRVAAARTLQAVVKIYLASKKLALRPASYKVTELYLTGPYFRPLHGIGIGEIRHADIAARLSAIIRKHSSPTAAAARRAISALFKWAMQEGWITANPVVGTRPPAEAKARSRVLTSKELATVWRACEDDEFGRIVRLLILLGQRPQEIGGLRYSELAPDCSTWTLPEERSKNHRAHEIDLPATARAIIRSVPRRQRDCLFGARSDRGFTLWSLGRAALARRLAGAVTKPWQLRDLRRTVATGMADIGVEPHVIEAVLNHFSGHRAGVAGIYNRSPYRQQVKTALARWANHVVALIEGRASNVVALEPASGQVGR
jgi:integrase